MTSKERYAAWKEDVVKMREAMPDANWNQVETPEMTLLAHRLIDIPPCSWMTMEQAINRVRYQLEKND